MNHLFVLDPLNKINPLKDSSAALMQAAQRAGIKVSICTPADLFAKGKEGFAIAKPVKSEPWIQVEAAEIVPFSSFQCIWMRKDPPVDEAFLYATHLLELGEKIGVLIINKPSGLRAWNEKLSALNFSNLMAPTLVSSRIEELSNFANEHIEIVLKPLSGKGGEGVVRFNKNYPGLNSLLEIFTSNESLPVMIQEFLPEVIEGDKRILIVNGEPVGAINRRPRSGEFRSNLALGGKAEITELSTKDQKICRELSPILKKEGLFFVGIDVIGGRLSEINVTSPTGIREIEQLTKLPIADNVINILMNQFY